MSQLLLVTRSFHPDRNFGMGGLGFHGDSRGFSSSLSVTSRITHEVTIDLKAAKLTRERCFSDPSSNEVIPRVLEGRGDRGVEIIARDELADRGVDIPQMEWRTRRDVLPKMENDYSQPRKHPRKNTTGNIFTLQRRW